MDSLVTLAKLFDGKIFRIPDYQRGFAWEEEQLSDFWEDLSNLTDDRNHYTGMLSFKKLEKEYINNWTDEKWIFDDKGYEAYHVVDGQQRLTTCAILINSILTFVKKIDRHYLNGESIENIKERYIIESRKPQNILKAYKFGYESDNPSFEYLRYYVFEENNPGDLVETFYTLNLHRAKKYFDEKVEKLFNEKGIEGIEFLLKKLTTSLKFNIHYISSNFDVFVAFETMNNRGKKLSNLELMKNRLIYLTTLYPEHLINTDEKNKLREKINDAWKEVYFQLGRNKNNPLNDDEYLKNHWILHFKYSRNRGDDYIRFLLDQQFHPNAVYGIPRTVKIEEIDEHDDEDIYIEDLNNISEDALLPNDITEYIESLKSAAKYWYYISNPRDNSGFDEEEIKWLNKLDRIGMAYFKPLVVATYINDEVTTEERIKLFKVIEKFIFLCFRMAKYQASYLSHIGYSYARELYKKEKNIGEITTFFEENFIRNIPEATETFATKINANFKNGTGYYGWYDLKYFLFEYELSLSEKTFIVRLDDWTNFIRNKRDYISIEHIFPQTPTRWYWRNQFRNFNDKEQLYLSNSLGNLLALAQSINSSLQNDEFEEKKKPSKSGRRGYSKGSNSELEIYEYKDWNPKTILERGNKLLSFMEERWGFKFNDDKRYELLGLGFMREERDQGPDLLKEDFEERDRISSTYESALTISDYLEKKQQKMTDIYYVLYKKLKEKVPSFFEVAYKNYIAFKLDSKSTLAEIHVQSAQIKILISEPSKIENRIGTKISDSYGWTKNYSLIIKKMKDIDRVVEIIHDNVNGL